MDSVFWPRSFGIRYHCSGSSGFESFGPYSLSKYFGLNWTALPLHSREWPSKPVSLIFMLLLTSDVSEGDVPCSFYSARCTIKSETDALVVRKSRCFSGAPTVPISVVLAINSRRVQLPTSTTKSVADPRVLFGLSIRGSTLCSRNAPGRCNGDGCCESSLHDASLAPAERRGNRGCKQYIIERFRRENYDIIVLTYVDYCIILARDKGTITKFIATLRLGPEKFDFTDEGTLDKYLGVEVQRQPKGFSMSQPFLIERIITAANIDARMTNPKATPAVEPLLGRDENGPERKCGCSFGHLAGCLKLLLLRISHALSNI